MAIVTKMRLHAISGSFDPAAPAGVVDTDFQQSGDLDLVQTQDLGDLLSKMASAIRRVNGGSDSFLSAGVGELQSDKHLLGRMSDSSQVIEGALQSGELSVGVEINSSAELRLGDKRYSNGVRVSSDAASAVTVNDANTAGRWNDGLKLSKSYTAAHEFLASFPDVNDPGKPLGLLEALVQAKDAAPAGVIKYADRIGHLYEHEESEKGKAMLSFLSGSASIGFGHQTDGLDSDLKIRIPMMGQNVGAFQASSKFPSNNTPYIDMTQARLGNPGTAEAARDQVDADISGGLILSRRGSIQVDAIPALGDTLSVSGIMVGAVDQVFTVVEVDPSVETANEINLASSWDTTNNVAYMHYDEEGIASQIRTKIQNIVLAGTNTPVDDVSGSTEFHFWLEDTNGKTSQQGSTNPKVRVSLMRRVQPWAFTGAETIDGVYKILLDSVGSGLLLLREDDASHNSSQPKLGSVQTEDFLGEAMGDYFSVQATYNRSTTDYNYGITQDTISGGPLVGELASQQRDVLRGAYRDIFDPAADGDNHWDFSLMQGDHYQRIDVLFNGRMLLNAMVDPANYAPFLWPKETEQQVDLLQSNADYYLFGDPSSYKIRTAFTIEPDDVFQIVGR